MEWNEDPPGVILGVPVVASKCRVEDPALKTPPGATYQNPETLMTGSLAHVKVPLMSTS